MTQKMSHSEKVKSHFRDTVVKVPKLISKKLVRVVLTEGNEKQESISEDRQKGANASPDKEE